MSYNFRNDSHYDLKLEKIGIGYFLPEGLSWGKLLIQCVKMYYMLEATENYTHVENMRKQKGVCFMLRSLTTISNKKKNPFTLKQFDKIAILINKSIDGYQMRTNEIKYLTKEKFKKGSYLNFIEHIALLGRIHTDLSFDIMKIFTKDQLCTLYRSLRSENSWEKTRPCHFMECNPDDE